VARDRSSFFSLRTFPSPARCIYESPFFARFEELPFLSNGKPLARRSLAPSAFFFFWDAMTDPFSPSQTLASFLRDPNRSNAVFLNFFCETFGFLEVLPAEPPLPFLFFPEAKKDDLFPPPPSCRDPPLPGGDRRVDPFFCLEALPFLYITAPCFARVSQSVAVSSAGFFFPPSAKITETRLPFFRSSTFPLRVDIAHFSPLWSLPSSPSRRLPCIPFPTL